MIEGSTRISSGMAVKQLAARGSKGAGEGAALLAGWMCHRGSLYHVAAVTLPAAGTYECHWDRAVPAAALLAVVVCGLAAALIDLGSDQLLARSRGGAI